MAAEIKKDVLALRERWRKNPNYGCFWSSPDNERGLQLTPVIEPGRIYLDLEIERFHSGFPGIANGGVSFAILDGMMSWYLMSQLGRAGFTKDCNVAYYRPLHVGKTYRFQVTAADKANLAAGHFDVVGQVFAIDSAGVVDQSRPLLRMAATFVLPNRQLARQVLQVDLGAEGDELFPE